MFLYSMYYTLNIFICAQYYTYKVLGRTFLRFRDELDSLGSSPFVLLS